MPPNQNMSNYDAEMPSSYDSNMQQQGSGGIINKDYFKTIPGIIRCSELVGIFYIVGFLTNPTVYIESIIVHINIYGWCPNQFSWISARLSFAVIIIGIRSVLRQGILPRVHIARCYHIFGQNMTNLWPLNFYLL